MLKNDKITLRTVQELTRSPLYVSSGYCQQRFLFSHGVVSEPVFRQRFHESGFWQKERRDAHNYRR